MVGYIIYDHFKRKRLYYVLLKLSQLDAIFINLGNNVYYNTIFIPPKLPQVGICFRAIVLYYVFILLFLLLLFAASFYTILFVAGTTFLTTIYTFQWFAETVGKGEVGYAGIA